MEIDFGTVVTVIVYVIGFIVGYTKLNAKVLQNTRLILLILDDKAACKMKFLAVNDRLNDKILIKFDKLSTLISLIKRLVSRISSLISKLSGIIETYLKGK